MPVFICFGIFEPGKYDSVMDAAKKAQLPPGVKMIGLYKVENTELKVYQKNMMP